MPVSWTSRKVAPVPDRELSRRTYAPLPRELLRSVGRRHAARRPGRLRVIEQENSHRSGVLLLGEPMAKRVSRVTLSPFQSLHSSIQLSYSTLSIWPCAWNPPNGSWGMVKVQPTGAALTSRIPPTAVGGWLRSGLPNPVSRPLRQPGSLDFNHPPTAVGGI